MGFWQSVGAFFKGPPDEAENSNPFVRRGALWAHLALRLSLAIGVLSVLIYAATQEGRFFLTAGLGLLLLCASFLVGGTLGFLFGIPKKLQQTPAPAPEKPSPAGDSEEEEEDGGKARLGKQTSYESNTSLEQISDWLTKILVGLTLTQWNDLRTGFQDVVEYMAPAFGANGEIFTGGIVIVGALCGFFFGYLPTRLFLWLALTESDLQGDKLSEARKDKNLQEAESLRNLTGGIPSAAPASDPRDAGEEPAETIETTRPIKVPKPLKLKAREYEDLRAKFSPGADRTRKLEETLSEMRKLAAQIDEETRMDLQKSGSPGERLAAVARLQVYPQMDALFWLADRIGAEKPFIAYHAALALLAAARDPNVSAQQVLEAVKRAQAFLEPNDAGTDRAKVLVQAEQEARAQMKAFLNN
jgi:hypothetical protein